MTKQEYNSLPLGLYRIFWKQSCGGGMSLAAIGMTENGSRWIAPTNWVAPASSPTSIYKTRRSILRVEMVVA
jgi:hypothetical protein